MKFTNYLYMCTLMAFLTISHYKRRNYWFFFSSHLRKFARISIPHSKKSNFSFAGGAIYRFSCIFMRLFGAAALDGVGGVARLPYLGPG